MDQKENPIVKKSFDFAADVLDFNERLINVRHFVLAKQVVRSGTSIGANVREAQRAVSKADFINKMGTALKEQRKLNTGFLLLIRKFLKLMKS